ncbi:hypothetical protein MGS_04601, partial [Candida albicans P78042]
KNIKMVLTRTLKETIRKNILVEK